MKKKHILILSLLVVGILLMASIPPNLQMPVKGAGRVDYDQQAFWAYPWGKSVTHKGVDIFAKRGTGVSPAESGIVVYTGQFSLGGNVVLVMSAGWRLHYYAHLDAIDIRVGRLVSKTDHIGSVGTTGNAAGKPAHLHYSIQNCLPYWWKMDSGVQGWKKMFYINPIPLLNEATASKAL